MKKHKKAFHLFTTHRNLTEVLIDHELASLGDSFVNFVYSLALSIKKQQPSGAKVKGHLLAEALRKAGLREYMQSRITRHMLADAAEALAIYAWLHDYVTLQESVSILKKADDPIEGFSQLLRTIKNRIKF